MAENPSPVQYPVSAGPTISGTEVTVDFLLADPKRVTRAIADLALQRFFVDRVFAPAGDITGGAVVYDVAEENELYAKRDVQRVEPGEEFPEVTFARRAPRTAQVEKFGGTFRVTDEARRRNRVGPVNKALLQLANTIRRKTQQRAVEELEAAVDEFGRTAVGQDWSALGSVAEVNKIAAQSILADISTVQRLNEELELGYSYNLAIMSPADYQFGILALGSEADFRAVLAAGGVGEVWRTNRKEQGSVFWLSERQVGELGYEVPLATETWRDKDGKQQDWYQSSILPIVYVTDPFAILETTGHSVPAS